MFEIGSSSTTTSGMDAARARFESVRALEVPNALSQPLLDMLLTILERGTFPREEVARLGHRGVETPPTAGRLLALSLRRAAFLEWLRQVTDLHDITGVSGSIVETATKPDEELTWHDDLNQPERRLAVTVDLSPARYEGAHFAMRRKGEDAPFLIHQHANAGSLLMFAIAPDIEHRLMPLSGGGPRRVFAGWFTADAKKNVS